MKAIPAITFELDETDVAILRELQYEFPNYIDFLDIYDHVPTDDLGLRLFHFKEYKLAENGGGWRVTAKGLGVLHDYEVDYGWWG